MHTCRERTHAAHPCRERAHLGWDDPVIAELLCHVCICFRHRPVPNHHGACTNPLLLPGTLLGQWERENLASVSKKKKQTLIFVLTAYSFTMLLFNPLLCPIKSRKTERIIQRHQGKAEPAAQEPHCCQPSIPSPHGCVETPSCTHQTLPHASTDCTKAVLALGLNRLQASPQDPTEGGSCTLLCAFLLPNPQARLKHLPASLGHTDFRLNLKKGVFLLVLHPK